MSAVGFTHPTASPRHPLFKAFFYKAGQMIAKAHNVRAAVVAAVTATAAAGPGALWFVVILGRLRP